MSDKADKPRLPKRNGGRWGASPTLGLFTPAQYEAWKKNHPVRLGEEKIIAPPEHLNVTTEVSLPDPFAIKDGFTCHGPITFSPEEMKRLGLDHPLRLVTDGPKKSAAEVKRGRKKRALKHGLYTR
jgi:hypothetical protein